MHLLQALTLFACVTFNWDTELCLRFLACADASAACMHVSMCIFVHAGIQGDSPRAQARRYCNHELQQQVIEERALIMDTYPMSVTAATRLGAYRVVLLQHWINLKLDQALAPWRWYNFVAIDWYH